MTEPIHILSLGAGVQSSTLALMAATGEITPMPHCAIFADTQAEPASVYRWLDWLEKQLPFPVHRVTKGSLTDASLRVRTSAKGLKYTKHAIPAFIVDSQGRKGLLMRQCTLDFKISVIYREITRVRRECGAKSAIQWIGISRDEADRMKPSRVKSVVNIWPLVDAGITRAKCLQWIKAQGFPAPPRSSCVYCPYHSDFEWKRLRDEEPEEFERAAKYDEDLRASLAGVIRGTAYLHSSRVPLRDADFRSKDEKSGQENLFRNECEGHCGV
jgi:hypothetical protein